MLQMCVRIYLMSEFTRLYPSITTSISYTITSKIEILDERLSSRFNKLIADIRSLNVEVKDTKRNTDKVTREQRLCKLFNSKSPVKRLLSKRPQNCLTQVKSNARGAFCNTFDLH